MANFRIDAARSRVWIDARSSLHPIHSETSGLNGWIEAEVLGGGRLDPSAIPRARMELPVELLSSGNVLYDREMRRRVNARRHPVITGHLKTMSETRVAGRYRVGGEVSFRGITRDYEDEMTMTMPDPETLYLEGERQFDIRDFGMEPPRILTLRVHPEVAVKVAIVAVRQGAS